MDDCNNAAGSKPAHEHVQDLLARVADASGALGETDAGGRETLTAWFERLRAHLYKQIALEEHDVFLGSVLEHRPTLAPQVERLKLRQRTQLVLADTINLQLQYLTTDDRPKHIDCLRQIRHFITEMRHTTEAKALLLLSAFTCDLGGEGG